VGSGNTWDALNAVRVLRSALEERIVELIEEARREGWSWQGIGDVLGMTAQAVHKRYAALLEFEAWESGQRRGRGTGPQVR
jgi:hypothetical protein